MFLLLLCFCGAVFSASEDCTTLHRESRCESIFEDQSNCFNDTYRAMLPDCLVTCNACDSYTCSNPQPDSVFNCSALATQCNSDTFGDFMKEKCPSTCGKCNRKNANLCSDKSKSDVCSTLSPFCNTIDYYDLLTAECPSTCNRCPTNGTNPDGNSTGECQDVAADCILNQDRCTNAQYAPLMHRLCPKTCNSCATCEDYNKMCQHWTTQGFCNRYSQPVVMKNCPKTCGLCNNK